MDDTSSGAFSTPHSPLQSRDRKGRGKLILLAALSLAAIGLGIRAIRETAWYEEWHLSNMTLAQLQRERAGRLDRPLLLYHIGLRLSEQSRFVEADAYFRNAVGLEPDDPRLRDAWAQALVRSGQITPAFGELRQFVGTHPNSSGGHLALGKFYLTQASLIRASEELTRAVQLEPSLGEGWSFLTAAETGLGHPAVALKASERAVALRPGNAKDRLGLALLLLEAGKSDRAQSVFAEAVALDPRSAAAHREYARCLLKVGKTPRDEAKAEAEARQSLALGPQDWTTMLILGQVLVAEGRASEGIEFLQRASRRSPFDPASALTLAQAYRRLHQEAQAGRWEEVYRERNQRQALKESLITAIQASPHSRAPQRSLARLLAEEGDVGGCLRHEAEALHRSLDAPPALVAAANDLTAAGRPAAALLLAEKAVDSARNNPMAREAAGSALLALGRPYDAAKAYRQAVLGMPDRLPLYQKRLDEYYRQHVGQLSKRSGPLRAHSLSP